MTSLLLFQTNGVSVLFASPSVYEEEGMWRGGRGGRRGGGGGEGGEEGGGGGGGGKRQLSNIELKQVSNLFVALPMC